jgi:hypothetical protein
MSHSLATNDFASLSSIGNLQTELNGTKFRALFVRWNASADKDAWEVLKRFSSAVGNSKEILRLSDRGDGAAPECLLRDLVQRLWVGDPVGKDEVIRALDKLDYSSRLEEAVICRLKEAGKGSGSGRASARLVLAALSADQRVEDSTRLIMNWLHRLEHDRPVLILAPQRPSDERIDEYRFASEQFADDVLEQLGSGQASIPNKRGSSSEEHSILEWLLRAIGVRKSRKPSDASEPGGLSEQEILDRTEEWAATIARLAAPNIDTVYQFTKQRLTILEKVAILMPEKRGLKPVEAPSPGVRLDLRLNNEEEKYTLEARLYFLLLFKLLHPKAYHATLLDPDGTDQLYRLHLILVGETAGDTLISSALLPEWRLLLQDSLFRELFQSCFGTLHRELPLVPRFESRLQLQSHLHWLEGKAFGTTGFSDSPLANLLGKHQLWLQRVAAQVDEVGIRLPPLEELTAAADHLLKSHPSSADALQGAQILLSVAELSGEGIVSPTFKALVRSAVRSSRVGISFDAGLAIARSQALTKRFESALRRLRLMMRSAGDELVRLAVKTEIGFVHERKGDLYRARQIYQDVIRAAEEIGADELLSRAASGCLRCDSVQRKAPQQNRPLRAHIMLRIQSARATELAPLTMRSKPKLFLSHRDSTTVVAHGLHEAISTTTAEYPGLSTFFDKNDIRKMDDFSPKIHSALLDSDGIVLLMSKDFFDSPWCVHELHFALGQHEVRGTNIFWAWCVENSEKTEFNPEEAVRSWLEAEYDKTAPANLGYKKSHLDDRIQRVFQYGTCLSNAIFRYSKPPNRDSEEYRIQSQLAGEELAPEIKKAAHYMYERAHLPIAPARVEGSSQVVSRLSPPPASQ